MAYKIDPEVCIGCGACEGDCPVEAIIPADDKYTIQADVCIDCGACESGCPVEAISAE